MDSSSYTTKHVRRLLPEKSPRKRAHEPLHPVRKLVKVMPLISHDAQQVAHAAEVVFAVSTSVFRKLRIETHVPGSTNDRVGPRFDHDQERRLDGILQEMVNATFGTIVNKEGKGLRCRLIIDNIILSSSHDLANTGRAPGKRLELGGRRKVVGTDNGLGND